MQKVIGYDSIKETLRQIADVLKRPEAYKAKRGVHAKRTSDGVCPRTRKEPDGIDIDGRVWTKNPLSFEGSTKEIHFWVR